jgi:uracil-DNA glycosylase family 4
MSLLREYLTVQFELGAEEIILPNPLAKKASGEMRAAPVGAQKRPPTGGGEVPPAAVESRSDAGGEASLAQLLRRHLKGAEPETAAPATALSMTKSPEISLPAFAGLNEYWEHVEKNLQSTHGVEAKALVRAAGPQFAPLALVAMEPGEGVVFSAASQDLLEKMMRAIRLDLAGLYVTSLMKAQIRKTWSRRELVRLLPWLHAELSLAKPPLSLLLGEACAQAILKTGKPLEDLRQTVHTVDGREFVATWHPEDLMRDEGLKRKAWADLQWLEKRLRQS